MRFLAILAALLTVAGPASALTPAQKAAINNPCAGVVLAASFAGGGGVPACYNSGVRASFTSIPGYSFTRASQETCTDASGLITYAANNVPCVNSAGYAAWQAATNLTLWSQDVSQAGSWSSTYASIAGGQSAPDGTTTGQNLVEGASTQSWRLFQSYTKAASAIAYTRTQIIKPGGRTSLYVRDDDGTTTNCVFVAYSLSGSGSIGTAATVAGTWTSPSATIKALSGGYYLVTLTFTTGTGTTLRDLYGSNDGSAATVNTPSIAGINATAFTDWAHQLETGSFPTPYIPTTTASATRAADNMTFPWPSVAQGTVVASWVQPAGTISTIRVIGTETANTPIFLQSASQIGSFNNSTALIATGSLTVGAVTKGAMSWGPSGRALAVNGGTPATDAAALGAITSLKVGSQNGSAFFLNSTLRSFAIYSTVKNTQAASK